MRRRRRGRMRYVGFVGYGTGVEGMTIQTPDLSGEYLQEMSIVAPMLMARRSLMVRRTSIYLKVDKARQ